MSESDGEQAARSLALEQAYVHDVYEQCADRTVEGKHWPRICQFLEELEPGALVCDIGCGNGKYLNVNHNLYKIGVDRCKRFTNIAREKDNEVLACDNLSLPFRDESFDAVLSIAVVHHFTTTERRVRALKELARVLRIGGRLIISVWAMEQKHRKFESQDVLVPWPKAYCINSSGSPMKPRDMAYDDRHRGKNAQTYLLSKRNSQRKGSNNKSYWIDPIFSPSPSTSSLSSPNETCYSFFRRALQKLAGGRRNSRAWFLENWQNAGKDRRNYDDDDDGDVDDLPIELRRLEDHTVLPVSKHQPHRLQQQHSDSLSIKSKSLSNIIEVQRLDLVRSRSSIPGLCNTSVASFDEPDQQVRPNVSPAPSKPRLVKQKTHFLDDSCLDVPENTAIQQLLKDIPELQVSPSGKRGNVHKQSSMNEELMSIERLKERESVRRNIMKQASLNEELIYKNRPTFEAFKDTFYSGSATKRFQLLKSGLTNRIKQSTTNIEKVSGMAIKNGFVRILQSWKSTDSPTTPTNSVTTTDPTKTNQHSPCAKRDSDGIERRPSREDGSDSSKDSSLQSDTSVDSEDSFASVIYVPKKSSSPLIEAIVPAVGCQLNATSAPPSPRLKYAPELAGAHRLKLISMSPLLKQFPATSKSLPPPSPPGLSPRTLGSCNARPFFAGEHTGSVSLLERIAEAKRTFDVEPITGVVPVTTANVPVNGVVVHQTTKAPSPPKQIQPEPVEPRRPTLQTIHNYRSMSSIDPDDEINDEDTSPLITDAIDEALERLSEKSLSSSDSTNTTTTEDEDSRRSRLNQIKELLRQKPGFATRTRPSFPLVRRASTSTSGRLEQVTKVLPRLLSLELFNPETDDLDSDSSGVSSPESVGSVISVISDERYVPKKDGAATTTSNNGKSEGSSSGDATDSSKDVTSTKPDELSESKNPSTDDSDSLIELSTGSSQSLRLLEAAANVANSLEDAVGTVIQQKAASRTGMSVETTNVRANTLDKHISPVESTWNEECNRHLIDLTDRLSENLNHDVDQTCRRTKLEIDDEDSSNLASTRLTGICKYEGSPRLPSQVRQPDYCDHDNKNYRPETVIERSYSEESNEHPTKHSIESSDIGDSIENTISESSQSLGARRFCSASTASLASDRSARLRLAARSASEEAPSTRILQRQSRQTSRMSASNGTLSGSSSQESLPSDQITYHQYYHVFREGELDQLINKYVENLHIISSYYDHASWCIVAEKVQVWTI